MGIQLQKVLSQQHSSSSTCSSPLAEYACIWKALNAVQNLLVGTLRMLLLAPKYIAAKQKNINFFFLATIQIASHKCPHLTHEYIHGHRQT